MQSTVDGALYLPWTSRVADLRIDKDDLEAGDRSFGVEVGTVWMPLLT
jgi:hypothetical protein